MREPSSFQKKSLKLITSYPIDKNQPQAPCNFVIQFKNKKETTFLDNPLPRIDREDGGLEVVLPRKRKQLPPYRQEVAEDLV